ncbi:MAG: molybdopterin-guanine dinucleotide biosynthesis protein, partial [Deltaproteobacteria bacterium]|nr:molybdopterin-guanine dinucleotide biosynthesis protein [Deltaproteobacteria bacterium]
PYFSFVGRSNTGKTTVIEQLIPILVRKGIKVAVIKHHHNDFEIDKPGKDTYRYKQAGATMSILASPGKVAVVEDTENDLTLDDIIARYIHDVDLLIIEGFKGEKIPKIEVFLRKEGADTPVCEGDEHLIAIITDESLATSLPVFSRDNIQGVAQFIVNRFIGQKSS